MQFLEWLKNEILTNQFFSAALGGSVFYTVLNYIRSYIGFFYYKIKEFFIREITVSNYHNEEIYDQLLEFVSSRIRHPKNINIVRVSNQDNIDEYEDFAPRLKALHKALESDIKQLKHTITYGNHWFWYNWYTFISVSIKVEDHHANAKSDILNMRILSLFARFTRNEIYNKFAQEYQEDSSISKLFKINRYGSKFISLNTRQADSVFVSGNIKQHILNSINSLATNKSIYEKAGIKQVLGILLYGPPGTGKSSYILSLAKKLKRSVYYVDISNLSSDILDSISSIPANSFIVLEDIDRSPAFCIPDEVINVADTDVKSLPNILRLLDGTELKNNTVIFATTNYIDKIDPAVKRFGRFDLQFEFVKADKELAKQMIDYINPSAINILDEMEFPISQAEVQAKILKTINIKAPSNEYEQNTSCDCD